MRVEALYNKQFDTTTFYVWEKMTLVDKLIYSGVMSASEVEAERKKILSKHDTKLNNCLKETT